MIEDLRALLAQGNIVLTDETLASMYLSFNAGSMPGVSSGPM